MKRLARALAALALCLAALAATASEPQSRALHAGWEFRLAPDDPQAAAHPEATQWHAAQVPGNVHTDLLAARLIADPYVGAPEAGLQWIGLGRWEYRLRFDVDAATLRRAHAELAFAGLDTYATVELNGARVLDADNHFRTWRVPVAGKLRARGNTLRIVFDSPIRKLLPRVQAMPHKIAGNYPSPYGDEPKDAMVGNFVRKPGYHFGWDWGPRYVTAGVWRAVTLESWDALRIDDLRIRQRTLGDAAATLDASIQLEADATVHYQPVQVECEQFRVNVDMDIDSAADAKPVGSKYEWDVVSDLVPGAYASVDLSRRMTLRPLSAKA